MRKPNEYQKLDDALVSAMRAGVKTFAKLQADQAVNLEVERVVARHGGEAFRHVDRRLQALRRAGAIQYSRVDGWHVATAREATIHRK